MFAGSLLVVFLMTASAFCQTHQNMYNITMILKAGGPDQEGEASLLVQGKLNEWHVVYLGDWKTPLPAGMVRGFGADIDFIPAHDVTSIEFIWFERGDKGKSSLLLDRLIVDPVYLNETPAFRSYYTRTFCPDAKDVPTKSWNYITLHPC